MKHLKSTKPSVAELRRAYNCLWIVLNRRHGKVLREEQWTIVDGATAVIRAAIIYYLSWHLSTIARVDRVPPQLLDLAWSLFLTTTVSRKRFQHVDALLCVIAETVVSGYVVPEEQVLCLRRD
jgi:hypothetical protein